MRGRDGQEVKENGRRWVSSILHPGQSVGRGGSEPTLLDSLLPGARQSLDT
jgi:hypothetical protein